MSRRILTPAEQKFKDDVINTIRSCVAASSLSGLTMICPWKTETIFTTNGLDTAFPPNSFNKARWYHTKHNIVYDIIIELKNRMPDKIVFAAKFTELSLEPQNITRRNEIFRVCGKALSAAKYPNIKLIESLPVTNGSTFLSTLKTRVDYFLNFAIPSFEKKLTSFGGAVVGSVQGVGFEIVDSNGKPSGEISFDLADGRCGKPDPVPVLKVTADFDGDVYLRSSSAGDYLGKTFAKAPIYTGAVPYNAYFIKRDIMNNNGIAKNNITVELEPYITKFLYPCDAFGNKKNAVVDDVDIDGDIGVKHTYTLDMIKQNWAMGLNSVSGLVAIENNYRTFVYANYLKVPEHTRKVIDKIFSEHDYWKKGTGVLPAMDYICTYLKYGHKPDPEYRYSYDFKIPDEEEDHVAYFLTGGTGYKGVCRQFASAATMMFRVFGIPARMTGGYHCKVNNGVSTQVTSCDAHGWVEVYDDGFGWIIVDPTP